jgi:hypothetical protein|tara:strand:+ start:59 stop:280 length:222 start_codon:yes stop_codon:yes gene_type:complete
MANATRTVDQTTLTTRWAELSDSEQELANRLINKLASGRPSWDIDREGYGPSCVTLDRLRDAIEDWHHQEINT